MAGNHGQKTNSRTVRITATASRSSELNWGARYGKNYKKQCAAAHKQHKKVGSRCCVCLAQRATEMHHSSYGGNRLGDNWFPVCGRCHDDVCHHVNNWIKDANNPVWGNRNTEEFTKRLRLGFQLLYAAPLK